MRQISGRWSRSRRKNQTHRRARLSIKDMIEFSDSECSGYVIVHDEAGRHTLAILLTSRTCAQIWTW